jgi:hypothetical protein
MEVNKINDDFFKNNHLKLRFVCFSFFTFIVFCGTAIFNASTLYNGHEMSSCYDEFVESGSTILYCLTNISNKTSGPYTIDDNAICTNSSAEYIGSILIILMVILVLTMIISTQMNLKRHRLADFLLKYGILVETKKIAIKRLLVLIIWLILLILISFLMFIISAVANECVFPDFYFQGNLGSIFTIPIIFWITWLPIMLKQYQENKDFYTHIGGETALATIKTLKIIKLDFAMKIAKETKFNIKLFKKINDEELSTKLFLNTLLNSN